MDTNELETLLEAAGETPNMEFKTACKWDVKLLIKDLLAISNTRDGGHIIIGISNDQERKGVSDEQKKTYNIEIMRDQVSSFADPDLRFTVEFVKDRTNIEFVVITVQSFHDIPIICKKDSTDVNAGTIYYRSKRGRAASAAISNSYEMRDLIELAISRRQIHLVSLGFISKNNALNKKLDDELNGL